MISKADIFISPVSFK